MSFYMTMNVGLGYINKQMSPEVEHSVQNIINVYSLVICKGSKSI